MGCACGGSSTRTSAGAQQVQSTAGGSAHEFEVTYNDGGTRRFATEAEALSALSFKGGGYRQVPK